ncbi:MAG: pyridoxal phosphate-dependent aminotransferase [Candidatus Atelocyanobacterium thalassa]|uniref:Aminotransferase n=1 Tax=Candidatus Atelocyanobacterium thalassa isolate SIO64986 TaxID=1527444 RepID=A0A086CHA7_9CHRO|nr:MAG: aspartate/tyrosine/aromatic aminotransferase [Candidatus Atelocyanobacterium thalassa isolate SIO64986]
MNQLAARVKQITPSITLGIAAKAKQMKTQGIDIYNLSSGEPDFDTPQHIKNSAILALQEGKTKYGPVSGELALKEALVNKLKEDNGLDYTPDNIIVTNGGKHSLFNLMLALIESGDEVIIPAPYWLSYPEMVRLAKGIPVIVETKAETNYKITPEQLLKAITPKTKLFILNSPSNPTGAVYTYQELKKLAEIIIKYDIWVVSDEIYEKILYSKTKHISIGALGKDILRKTIISNGFSKSYAMTGWRLGYLAGPSNLIKAVSTIQSHSTSNVCTFAQYGAIAALKEKESSACVQEMLNAFTNRRNSVLKRVASIPQISCPIPMGAFYVFIDISQISKNSIQFSNDLLEKYQVAVIPGQAFGNDDCIRVSYAADLISIKKGMDKIEEFINTL